MKKSRLYIALIAIGVCFSMSGFSQSPDFFNYQAIIRDASSNPITNTSVDVDITIRQGSTGGTDVYAEAHTVVTNDFGLIAILIGNGSGAQNLADIDWSAGPYFLKVDIDDTELSNTQLISVPYAKYASAAANGVSSAQTDDWNSAYTWGDHALADYSPATNDFIRDNDSIYYIDGNVGIGTMDPRSTLTVYGTTPNDTAIFEVKNNLGRQVFAVYNDGVRITIDETYSKGAKGGFAIGGYDETKAGIQDYLTVNADSTRVYVKQETKAEKGGFAIGGFDNTKKGVLFNFVDLTPENYFIGHGSGSSITTGKHNSFYGYQTGTNNTSGNYNIFMGYKAGLSNESGNNNIFLGNLAGFSNLGGDLQAGTNNVFIGNGSGAANTIGQDNVFLGYLSGAKNVKGDYNVFLGHMAGKENTVGSNNVYIGYDVGLADSTGKSNVYIGFYAAKNANKGTISNLWNVSIGAYSGYNLNGTIANTFVGYDAGRYTSTGSGNTFLGTASGKQNMGGRYNTFVGSGAGRDGTATVFNTFVGESAGMNIDGNYNTLVGSRSGIMMTSGYGNTFVGKNTGESRTTGSYNILIGLNTGLSAGTGSNNVIIGANSAQETFGQNNTFLGHESGHETTGSDNVFLGYKAGYNELGSHRLYIANFDADSANALIYGEFDNEIILINGSAGIGRSTGGDSLHVYGNIRITDGSFIDDGTPLSDFVFEPNYKLESIEDHSIFMWQNKHLPAIKSAMEIKQNGGYDISLRREQILEELEKAHIYIEQLNNKIKTLEEENSKMKETQTLILKKIEELLINKK